MQKNGGAKFLYFITFKMYNRNFRIFGGRSYS